jgi:hypothetical protein
MNTKQAKDFLVQQTGEQAVLENVSLSDIEKEMMYFTESDPTSCENPLELNDQFEAKYDTREYEVKISRLLHHAYGKLRARDPEKKCEWDEAVRELRKGDHYLLVLWDIEPPSDHPTRDFFKLLGIGILVALGIGMAIVVAAIYKIDLEHYRKYLFFVFIGFLLVASGFLRALYRVAVVWFYSRTMKDNYPN